MTLDEGSRPGRSFVTGAMAGNPDRVLGHHGVRVDIMGISSRYAAIDGIVSHPNWMRAFRLHRSQA